ncbi:hypothetical protein KY316_00310 [Candidatus Woesearchaeota archaeon]|nr:hypothetical protein [Candidatus Woesearchaeota archaeon]
MELSVKKGLSFGLTSGIITTLGLIVGLHSSTHSKLVVLGGILVIAVADALSDSLGMHISEESIKKTKQQIWKSTFATLFTKFIIAMTFVVPVLMFQLSSAIVVSIIWGLLLLTVLSYHISLQEKAKSLNVIFEHLAIAAIVIIVTHFVGDVVASLA